MYVCLVTCALLHGLVFCVVFVCMSVCVWLNARCCMVCGSVCFVCVYAGLCLVECALLHGLVCQCVLFVCVSRCVFG